MLQALRRTYLDIFTQHPVLVRLAAVGACVGSVYALVNGFALPLYVRYDLLRGDPQRAVVVIGLLASTFLGAEMLMKFPLGHLSDRIGRRPLITIGPAVSCVTALIIPLIPASRWALLFPLRAIDGMALAAVWPAAFALVAERIPAGSRASAMAVMWAVYMAGLAIGPALAGALIAIGPRAPFYLASGGLLLAALIARFGLPQRQQAQVDAHPPGEGEPAHFRLWPSPWRRRRMALILFITATQLTALTLLQPFLPLYAVEVLHLAKARAPLLFVVPAVLVAGLGLPMGRLSDRWGKGRSVKVAMILAATAMAALPLLSHLGAVMAVATVLMVAYMLGMPAWLALIGDLAPAHAYGGTLGVVATAQGVGATIGPIIGGHLWVLDFRYSFWASAALLGLCALLATAFLPSRPPAQATASASAAGAAPGET